VLSCPCRQPCRWLRRRCCPCRQPQRRPACGIAARGTAGRARRARTRSRGEAPPRRGRPRRRYAALAGPCCPAQKQADTLGVGAYVTSGRVGRRMLSNRESARRSRRRKQEHLSTLEEQARPRPACRRPACRLPQQLSFAEQLRSGATCPIANVLAHLLGKRCTASTCAVLAPSSAPARGACCKHAAASLPRRAAQISKLADEKAVLEERCEELEAAVRKRDEDNIEHYRAM